MGFRVVPDDVANSKVRTGVEGWNDMAGTSTATFEHGLGGMPETFVVTPHTNTDHPGARCYSNVFNVGPAEVTVVTTFPDYDTAPSWTQYELHWIAVMP